MFPLPLKLNQELPVFDFLDILNGTEWIKTTWWMSGSSVVVIWVSGLQGNDLLYLWNQEGAAPVLIILLSSRLLKWVTWVAMLVLTSLALQLAVHRTLAWIKDKQKMYSLCCLPCSPLFSSLHLSIFVGQVIQVFCIALWGSLQINHNILHEWGIVPLIKRVDKRQIGHGLCLTQFTGDNLTSLAGWSTMVDLGMRRYAATDQQHDQHIVSCH